MQVTTFPIGPLQTNCHVAENNGRALVVDPGGEPSEILAYLKAEKLELEAIVITHFHLDHIYGNAALAKATGAPLLANPEDEYLLSTEIGAGGFMGMPRVDPFDYQPLTPGEHKFMGLPCTVLHTPGHSAGSISLYFPDGPCVFVGDLIFARSIGRTDFAGGDLETLLAAVREKIFTLPAETVIYSGHGPDTTVGAEKAHNPFFNQF